MGFIRTSVVGEGKIPHDLRAGDGIVANVAPKLYAAETDETITMAELSGGYIIQGATLTSDVQYTTPTAALITAEWPEMDVGDSFVFHVENSQAGIFNVVLLLGVGITTGGVNNDHAVQRWAGRTMVLVKSSATAYVLY